MSARAARSPACATRAACAQRRPCRVLRDCAGGGARPGGAWGILLKGSPHLRSRAARAGQSSGRKGIKNRAARRKGRAKKRRSSVTAIDRRSGITIVEHEGWRLAHLTDRCSRSWCSFKLTKKGRRRRGKRRSWWLGHNGERLARNSDAGSLHEHEPEAYVWVEEVCRDTVTEHRQP